MIFSRQRERGCERGEKREAERERRRRWTYARTQACTHTCTHTHTHTHKETECVRERDKDRERYLISSRTNCFGCSLRVLDLAGNQLEGLPSPLQWKTQILKELVVSLNKITKVSEDLLSTSVFSCLGPMFHRSCTVCILLLTFHTSHSCSYWAVQAGLLTPLSFTRHRSSLLAAFTSGAHFHRNGRWWQWICEFYTANFKGIVGICLDAQNCIFLMKVYFIAVVCIL